MTVHNFLINIMHRFSPENKVNIHSCAFLTFGSGPRSCLGMRFAYLEAKMALIEVVSKYRILLAPETQVCPCYVETPY